MLAINRGAGDVIPTMLEIVGSAPSGSSPRSGLAAGLRHSLVSDLGGDGWNAGGSVATGSETAGTGKTIPLWNVTINDSGGVLQRFYICCQQGVNLKVLSDATVARSTKGGMTPPAGALAIAYGTNGNVVQFAVTYTPSLTSSTGSSPHSTIDARGGAHKVQRVSGGVYA